MAAKRRADQLLVDQGLAESRAKAQALILAGLVSVAGRRIDKAGTTLAEDAALTVAGRDHPWVSRGGLKLVHALDHFALDPAGLVALDIGASTGGFTDVLLAKGAALVALIKPQFEAGPKEVGKGGVVRDPAVHRAVCERIAAWLEAQPGWQVVGITESPITGPAGNREFLIYARRKG